MAVTIPILHFNDVYRVNPQKLAGGVTIDVTQFAYMLNSLRDAWPERSSSESNGSEKERDGLVLFSGDLFAPSVESSVTRGSHMVRRRSERLPYARFLLTGSHWYMLIPDLGPCDKRDPTRCCSDRSDIRPSHLFL